MVRSAVTIRRQLADARPDAFLADLAQSLNNLSLRLADLGRREDALDAIEQAQLRMASFVLSGPAAHLTTLALSGVPSFNSVRHCFCIVEAAAGETHYEKDMRGPLSVE